MLARRRAAIRPGATREESTTGTSGTTRIVIVGGGMAGLAVAKQLQKRTPPGPTSITVIDPNPYMTYSPFLPEVAGGHIEPRDVVVPFSSALGKAQLLQGKMTGIDTTARTITVVDVDGATRTVAYDEAVITAGAITRTFPTPGLADHAVGFKTVEEAAYVRDTMLANVAAAAEADDPDERRRLLTVTFVGGGYTGVEAMTELQLAAQKAAKQTGVIEPSELRFVLVEALDRVAPEVGPDLSAWTLEQLRDRGIDVRLKTQMPSCEGSTVVLSDGEEFASGLIVWTAGVKPNPVLDATDLPRGPKGHVNVLPTLQVAADDGTIVPGVWALGDNAQVPDLAAEQQPAYCPPNAQHATRQAKVAAANVIASLSGDELVEYRHASIGTVASYGPLRGAANIKGVQMTNARAWVAHRGYHLYAMPTLDRRWRILNGWMSEAIGANASASMARLRDPKRPIREATGDIPMTAPAAAGQAG